MPNLIHAAYQAADPYFDLARGALGDSVDGDHSFDIVYDGVVSMRSSTSFGVGLVLSRAKLT